MLPSGLICASPACPAAAAAGHAAPAQPIPVLTTPGELPGLLIFFLPAEFFRAQPVFAPANLVRIIFQPQFHRVHAEFHGKIIHRDSMPNDAGGCPGARKARAEPALTATADCFTRVFGTL
jgi:hypothetical protein